MADQHLNAEYDVVGGERHAVAPGHPIADLQGPLVQRGVGRHALADPALDLARFVVEHEQRFENRLVVALRHLAAGQVWIPNVRRQVAARVHVQDQRVGPVDSVDRGRRSRHDGGGCGHQ